MLQNEEETLKQDRYASSVAWKMAKCIYPQAEKQRTQDTFNSPLGVWCLPAPSSTKLEERNFVVDSGASIHAQQERFELTGTGHYSSIQKPYNGLSQPLEKCTRMRKQQCTSTTLMYSWQYKSSRIRLQSYPLENSAKITHTPMSGPVAKTTSYRKRQRIQCNTENFVPTVVPG